MASRRKNFQTRKINPTYYVFCEGKTEEAYVSILKSHYRLPSIIIKSKVSGSSISSEEIEKFRNTRDSHEKDKVFLMYDGDIPAVLNRIEKIKNSVKLISTPCIELWFLLHLKNHSTTINSSDCVRDLNKRTEYVKGKISSKLKEKLTTKMKDAVKRAKALNTSNPRSTVYLIIERLERLRG